MNTLSNVSQGHKQSWPATFVYKLNQLFKLPHCNLDLIKCALVMVIIRLC